MRKAFLLLMLCGSPAWAGGTEIVEQSAAAVGVAGAMTGRADEADAIFYNPAGLTRQRGLGVTVGGTLEAWSGQVKTAGDTTSSHGLYGLPTVYLTQRLGPHLAVGVGVFSQFAQRIDYPSGWAGALGGTHFDLTTTTINPSVSLRPHPRVSLGFGITVVPASLSTSHDSNQPGLGGESSATTGLGVGANVGILIDVVPRWLRLGISYRSGVDLTMTGSGQVGVTGQPAQALDATLAYSTPHNLALGLSSLVTPRLTLSADVRWTLWAPSSAPLSTTLTMPGEQPTSSSYRDIVDTNLRDSFAVRVGAEYRKQLPHDVELPLRIGLGVDTTPVRQAWLIGLQPDNLRVVVGAGIGIRAGAFGADLGYSIQILTDRTSTSPVYPNATYSALQHVASLSLSVRLEDFGGRLNVPEYKH